jgi:2-succinyl-5-enolpyruvyl-6-hydroxy-3-cyclohexene-1-carboxylate synthase
VVRVSCFDALLRSATGRAALAPELLLQVGAAPTSKSLELMAQADACPRFVLAPFGRPDPTRNARALLVGDVAAALDALSRELDSHRATRERASARADEGAGADHGAGHVGDYARRLHAWDEGAQALLDAGLRGDGALTEGAVTQAVVAALGDRDGLLLCNSLAIRHVDAYTRRARPTGPVHTQRGASGIDGLLAGAAGAASTGRAMVALVGDVSFLHDLGGLGAHLPGTSLTIVVLQNGGGRIFEWLPIASHPSAPMGSFTTDHHADLGAAARVYGHGYTQVRTLEALRAELAARVGHPGLHVIEAVVPPHDAGSRQRALYAQVEASLRAGSPEESAS